MATNDFKVFAGGSGANVITQPNYLSLAALTSGFQSGIAQSGQLNKVWRQSSIISAMIAQFICDNTGSNATDDGTIALLEQNFKLAIQGVTRTKATGPTTIFVNPTTGSDSNSGVQGSPKQTIQGALTAAYFQYDFGGNPLTIQLAPGTYNQSVVVNQMPLGCSAITILGNNSNPLLTLINVVNGNCVTVNNGAVVNLQGFTVQASGAAPSGYGIDVNAAYVTIQNISFGSCANVQINATLGFVTATGPLTFTGTSQYGIGSQASSFVNINGVSVTFGGVVTYTGAGVPSFALAAQGGALNAVGTIFTGSFVGVRYNANFCGTINVGGAGANFFPGTVAGVVANNAIYA